MSESPAAPKSLIGMITDSTYEVIVNDSQVIITGNGSILNDENFQSWPGVLRDLGYVQRTQRRELSLYEHPEDAFPPVRLERDGESEGYDLMRVLLLYKSASGSVVVHPPGDKVDKILSAVLNASHC